MTEQRPAGQIERKERCLQTEEARMDGLGKNTGMPVRHAEMSLGKLKYKWN